MKQASKSDERITAFALGEMQGPEKDLFEKDLDASVGMQNEVHDIQNFTSQLRRDLGREGLPAKDAKLFKNLMNLSGVEGKTLKRVPRKTFFWSAGLIAAGLAVVVAFLPNFTNKESEIKTADSLLQGGENQETLVVQPPLLDEELGPPGLMPPAEQITKKSGKDFNAVGRGNKLAETGESIAQKEGSMPGESKSEFNTEAPCVRTKCWSDDY